MAYICKYMMKEEKSSLSYTKAAKVAVDKTNEEVETRKCLQKILISSNTRDVSRQECFLMMSKKVRQLFSQCAAALHQTANKHLMLIFCFCFV